MTNTDNLATQPPVCAEPAVTAALEPNQSVAKLVSVLDDYLADLQAGKPADRAAVLAAHPDLASQLEQCLAGIEFIHRAGRPAGELPAQLGDFRIRREIGRGGMGVVYEAEQLSLHRIVALKILRFGAVADREALERFRNEAETVAKLHHTNIVPIFAVGNEHGVNFYAMQLIEGQSLADVIQRKAGGRRSEVGGRNVGVQPLGCGANLKPETQGNRLKPELQRPSVGNISEWGLQAAEALAHAHGRGVIHRDIKPSNLLLDNEGTLWLTDFGLAKRIDDVALTLTGAILGTPRYMSPEQATSTRQPVDHRTDIYSLGATLYELVTGQPVFAAETPHEVISQIITTEPRPPRQFDRSLPRDLETIVMKCLAKEPARRYQTARELADDLRAFIDGRPIAARRLAPVARAMRWVKKHRRTAGAMAAVAASVVVLLVGGFLAWRSHEESLLGQLSLSTSGPSLVAEVLDKDDRPVVPSIPVPSSQPVALREGSYQVRLSTPGMLSQTYPLEVTAGSHTAPDVLLEDRWLWPPMELKPGEFIEPVAFGRRTDLLLFRQSGSTLQRLDGATGKPVWPNDLALDKSNLPADADINEWQALLQAPWFNPWSSSWLAASVVDLDGDGEADLVFGSRKKPALIAVSGKTGKVLWLFRGRPMPSGAKDLSGLKPANGSYQDAPLIGRPVVAASSGEAPKIVGCFLSLGESYRRADNSIVAAQEQTWLEAVSGKTGTSAWRYPLPETLKVQNSNYLAAALEGIGQPQIARVGGRDIVVCAVNSTLYGVELETGKEAWPPHSLGFTPDAAPKIIDLGGGESEVLFVSGRQRNGNYGSPQKLALTAISLNDRRKAWDTKIDSVSRRDFQVSGNEATAPREVDVEQLGPNGAPAIVAAVSQMGKEFERANYMNGSTKGRMELVVLDPATGKPRWEKPLGWFGYDHSPVRWLVGDDLDGDGNREIFAAWIGAGKNGQYELIVAALSGRDGQTLWRWTLDGLPGDDKPPLPLCWWQPAENGRPQLVVPVGRAPGGQPATYILDSATGRLRHTLTGVADPRTCDLNGDGLSDLLYTVSPQGFARLMAVRGEPPIGSRWLDWRQRRVAQDFDGDGLDDFLISDSVGPVYPEQAVSGRDGRTLWKIIRQTMGNSFHPVSAPLPLGDLGGEGRPAVLALTQQERDPANPNASNEMTVAAFSGRDGHRLWPLKGESSQVLMHNGSSSGGAYGRSFLYPSIGLAQLDPHRPADVLVAVPDSFDATRPQGGSSYSLVWLNVVSGESGKLRWKAPFVHGQFGDNGRVYRTEFQDLNGDGVADVVGWTLPANAQPGVTRLELKAFSGKDGSLLWSDAPPVLGPQYNEGFMPLPIVGDLDGHGTPDVVCVRNPQWDKGELVAVGGRDGRIKWTWPWTGPSSSIASPQLVDFGGTGRHSVCLFMTEVIKTENSTTYQPRIVILDGAGKVLKKIDAKGNGTLGGQFYGSQSWWRSIDPHGDGKEALLFFDEGALQALGGESVEPLWKWPLPQGDTTLLEVLPAGQTFPATIAIWAGKSIYGLSCATGRPRWRGEVPGGGPNSSNGEQERVVMRDSGGPGLPRLLAGDGCRLTWPTDDDGRYQPPRGEPIVYAPVPDPVALRPLPWTQTVDQVPVIVKMIPWTLLWLIVPALLIRRAFKQNSWRLAFVPAFYQLGMTLALNIIPLHWLPFNRRDWIEWDPHVGMCFLSAAYLIVHAARMIRRHLWALVDASAIYAIAIAIGWSQRLEYSESEQRSYAIFHISVPESLSYMVPVLSGGLSFLAGAAFVILWLRRRQWIRLGLFLVASLAFAAIIAATLIFKDQYWRDEEYSMDGWWLVIVYGAYVAAGVTLAGWLAKHAFTWCRRRASRLLARLARKKVA